MDNNLFAQLLDSVQEADEIVKRERTPAREHVINTFEIKAIRESAKLSQEKFANLIHVSKGTLVNWEQGRRKPSGPAAVLLLAIQQDPSGVIAAIQKSGE